VKHSVWCLALIGAQAPISAMSSGYVRRVATLVTDYLWHRTTTPRVSDILMAILVRHRWVRPVVSNQDLFGFGKDSILVCLELLEAIAVIAIPLV
jgi:hypothetical protein